GHLGPNPEETKEYRAWHYRDWRWLRLLALRHASHRGQVADRIVRRALLGGLLRRGAGRRRVSVLESRPGEIGPGIAEVRGLLDRLVQHLLRIARPLGDQEQAAIVGLERLHRIRLLERDLEQFVGGIEIIEAGLGNHREAVIDGALLG